jgi:hypothetical protein
VVGKIEGRAVEIEGRISKIEEKGTKIGGNAERSCKDLGKNSRD